MFEFNCERTDYVQLLAKNNEKIQVEYKNGYLEKKSYILLRRQWLDNIFPDYQDEAFQIVSLFCRVGDKGYFKVRDIFKSAEANILFNELYEKQLLIFKLTGEKMCIKNYE